MLLPLRELISAEHVSVEQSSKPAICAKLSFTKWISKDVTLPSQTLKHPFSKIQMLTRKFAAKLSNRERHKKRSAGFGEITEYGRGVLHKAIKRWYALKDIDHCHACFAENNSRRLDWAQSK
ncbi:hypothetical protein ADUPG1_001923, partial [Aduncisulcus paluster]